VTERVPFLLSPCHRVRPSRPLSVLPLRFLSLPLLRERCHAMRDREGVFSSLPLQRERCRRAAATERVALAAFALGGTDLQIGAPCCLRWHRRLACAPFCLRPRATDRGRRGRSRCCLCLSSLSRASGRDVRVFEDREGVFPSLPL
jgi:hypothetical protein